MYILYIYLPLKKLNISIFCRIELQINKEFQQKTQNTLYAVNNYDVIDSQTHAHTVRSNNRNIDQSIEQSISQLKCKIKMKKKTYQNKENRTFRTFTI